MIGFIEEFPTEWQQKWDEMQRQSGHIYQRGPGTKIPPVFYIIVLTTMLISFIRKALFKLHYLQSLSRANNILTELDDLVGDKRPRLEQMMERSVEDETLKQLLPVVRGLMKFKPSERISAAEALELLNLNTTTGKRVLEAHEEVDDPTSKRRKES